MATTQFTARLDEQDIELFKQFVQDNNLTTAQAFNSMINLLELDKAKATIASRSKEIEQFQSYANSMIKAFINSLEINENAENRIREEFAKQLDTQIETISDLQERIKIAEDKAIQAVKEAEVKKEECDKKTNEAQLAKVNAEEMLKSTKEELQKAKDQLNNNEEVITLLRERASQYETDAKAYAGTLKEVDDLKEQLRSVEKDYEAKIKEKELEIAAVKLEAEKELSKVKQDSLEKQMSLKDEISALKDKIRELESKELKK